MRARCWTRGKSQVVKPSPSVSLLSKPVDDVPDGSLRELRAQAAHCRACPLWKGATQTVFGEGPARARMVLVGEQPGAQEDLAGRPFVGPAGKLLDRALEEAGLDRDEVYLTNVVKHFKYEERGKVRLHKRASAMEQARCRRWLAAELDRLTPRCMVGLGLMAAQTLFGNDFRIITCRGIVRTLDDGVVGLGTWHPSAVLRMRSTNDRERAYGQLVTDLRACVKLLA